MKRKTLTTEAMEVNNRTYLDYFDRLKLIATNRFKYNGLDEVFGVGASRFLENTLFELGRACAIKDPELGYLISKANPSDKLNVYNLPTRIMAWNIGYNKDWDLEDIVLIFNNEMQKPTSATVEMFAMRLYEIQRTMDVNLNAQKTPVLIEGDDKSILTLENVYSQYSGTMPVVFGNKNFDLQNKLNVLNTQAPYLLDKLALYKHEIWNECLTFLGVNNANIDKNQVVLTTEVNSNNDLIDYYLNASYAPRKRAIDAINEKYGLNIEIEMNKDLQMLTAQAAQSMGLGEQPNEGEM